MKSTLYVSTALISDFPAGKSTLLHEHINKTITETETTQGVSSKVVKLRNNPTINHFIWDISSTDSNKSNQTNCYLISIPRTCHALILCFSLKDIQGEGEGEADVNKTNYETLSHYLSVFLNNHIKNNLNENPQVPILLVGTMCDVENPIITDEEGKKLATELNLSGYISCSSKTMRNVDKVFETAEYLAVAYIRKYQKDKFDQWEKDNKADSKEMLSGSKTNNTHSDKADKINLATPIKIPKRTAGFFDEEIEMQPLKMIAEQDKMPLNKL